MTRTRILHIDDEADIREVIELSLSLDPAFDIRSCASGSEGVAAAAEWCPDLILLDVMMPVMDGPATLAQLRQNPELARVPVIFMTARAQLGELDRLRALGAVGVIAKPFDPMALAASVRDYMQPAVDPLEKLRANFLQRVRRDVAALAEDRAALRRGTTQPQTLQRIRQIAHGLAGAGGIYGFFELSDAAAAVEDATYTETAEQRSDDMLSDALDGLLAHAVFDENRQGTLEEAVTR
jgi:CheY-like chemotaxis protein